VWLACAVWYTVQADAQTTVVLRDPDSQVVDAGIRGGAYADWNFNDTLFTRASDNSEYARRALLKFDTQNTIPQGANIQSATLTVTVSYTNSQSRTLDAYRTTSSWDENTATWNVRYPGIWWGSAGGDLAGPYASATAEAWAGNRVSFDVTSLVQESVNGNFGSRFTRIALVDNGDSTSESYKEYYSSEAGDASVRPRLTVTYGDGGSSYQESVAPAPPPVTSSSSGTTATIKVLHWNTHHGGIGTDGVYNPDRLASWIATMNPHIVSLNEVDSTDQVNAIVNALQSRTGRTWSSSFSGMGNLVLTRLSVDAQSNCTYPDGVRNAAHMQVTINGRPVELWSTHLDVDSADGRMQEIYAMQNCALQWPEARLIAGDFNMQAGSWEYGQATNGYWDVWAAASANGTAINFGGNCDGCTRNSRIDYIFASKAAWFMGLASVQIFDTRDGNGIMPSDHKPMMATFTVK